MVKQILHTHMQLLIKTDLQTNLNNRLLLTGGTLSGDLRIARSSGHTRMSISTNDTGSTADVMVYFQHGATRPLERSTGSY